MKYLLDSKGQICLQIKAIIESKMIKKKDNSKVDLHRTLLRLKIPILHYIMVDWISGQFFFLRTNE